MIKLIFTALSLGSFFEAHSKKLSVVTLCNETGSGEYRRDFL